MHPRFPDPTRGSATDIIPCADYGMEVLSMVNVCPIDFRIPEARCRNYQKR